MHHLLREIEDAARPLYAASGEEPRVSLFHEVGRDAQSLCCAVLGDPGFSLLVGFGASNEAALLALLKEVRETRAASVYLDAPANVADTAHALAERLAVGGDDLPHDEHGAAAVAVARKLRQRTG